MHFLQNNWRYTYQRKYRKNKGMCEKISCKDKGIERARSTEKIPSPER
jgi:hypothetical protein